MSAADEMRAEKITFIPRIKPSLKTSLNSAAAGERRLARLGARVLPLSLPDDDSRKPDPDPQLARVSPLARRAPGPSFTSWRHMCSSFVREGRGGRRVETWHAMEKKKKEPMRGAGAGIKEQNFYMVNSMCPILPRRCYAELGRG